jgi:magnesium transporter
VQASPAPFVVDAEKAETFAAGGTEPTVLLFDRDRVVQLDDLDERPSRLRRQMLLWVDLSGFSEEGARRVAEVFELDDASAARLAGGDGAPSLRDVGEYVHVTATVPDRGAHDELGELECVVGERWVVTAHEKPLTALETFTERAAGTGRTGDLDGPSFLATLLEWVMNEYVFAFERIEHELEEFDARAMQGRAMPEDEIEHLIGLRICVGRLRRALLSHRETLLALAHPELEALGNGSSAERFDRLLDRFESTLESARDVRESTVSSFEVLIARTGYRTNEIVKVLTLCSVIFLPGALLAGVLGMNFKVGLFEHTSLFWVVIAVIVAIGVVTIATARVRRWI